MIAVRPAELPKKTPPAKPPQPKKSLSSADLQVSSNNPAAGTHADTSIPHSQSIAIHAVKPQTQSETAIRPARQPPAKPSKPPQPQSGQEWIVDSDVLGEGEHDQFICSDMLNGKKILLTAEGCNLVAVFHLDCFIPI